MTQMMIQTLTLEAGHNSRSSERAFLISLVPEEWAWNLKRHLFQNSRWNNTDERTFHSLKTPTSLCPSHQPKVGVAVAICRFAIWRKEYKSHRRNLKQHVAGNVENIVRCNPLCLQGAKWKTDAYGFKRNRILSVTGAKEENVFQAVVHGGFPKAWVCFQQHSLQPVCYLIYACYRVWMTRGGKHGSLPGDLLPSWLHHFISIGRWSSRIQDHCKEPTSILLLNVPSSPSFQLFPVIFLFSCFWRKYWVINQLAEIHSGFSKSGLITVNSLLHERWEMDPEMAESSSPWSSWL